MRKLLTLFLLLCTLFSCKPQVPREYIQPHDMEDILFDYHLAQGMAQQKNGEGGINSAMYQLAFREAVLKKHGVTEAEFDSSMVYYQRHTERLKGIYDNLAKRLSAEAQSLGASVDDVNGLGDLTMNGDTANVWKGEQSMVLSPNAPFNHCSFDIKADSSFHKGDRFILNFKSQFIYQDGMREGVAYLAVVFDNDSVATSLARISSEGKQTVVVNNDANLGIKEVKGYFVLSKSMESTSVTTLRLMFITQINLIRVHQAEQPKEEAEPADSLRNAHVSDSVRGAAPPTPPDRVDGPVQENALPPKNDGRPLVR